MVRLGIIDDIVVGEMGREVRGENWIIPKMKLEFIEAPFQKTEIPWITIEDNDLRWIYKGFKSHKENWNASSATLIFGYETSS